MKIKFSSLYGTMGIKAINWYNYNSYCRINNIKPSNYKEFIKYMEVRLNV